jgi:phosphoglycerol transferase MdoB-like AlkP superfamily enzyme
MLMPASINTALRRIGFLLFLYSCVRVLFLLNNWVHLKNETTGDLLFALVHGVRFDLSAILLINVVFIILWLLPFRFLARTWVERTLHTLFVLVNVFFLIANVTDVEFVNFNARRMTWAFFGLKQDVSDQLPQIMAHYWYFAIVAAGMLPVNYFFTPKRRAPDRAFAARTMQEHAVQAVAYLLFVFFLVFGIRGGFQNKPLREAHAFRGSAMLGHLTLNTPFTLINSRKKSHESIVKFFSDEEAKRILAEGPTPGPKPVKILMPAHRATNVVQIIIESFSREYMGEINGRKGYTPFLDSLVNKSLFFVNDYANARRSIDAIPALITGVPALLHESFLLSSYQGAQVRGLAQILSTHGYSTAFYHGAENGSMFFDSFSKRVGYDNYYGMNEYPEAKRDWDGFWGILDEPFLQFFAKKLTETKAPFYATIFTLSSHQPYPVPEHLKGKFPLGTLEIHKSVGYTDYSLEQFFKTAEKEPWFKDTLFVLTADHTSKSDDPTYANMLGPYRVPLLFYQKDAPWAGQKSERISQHIDVDASILDYLGFGNENMIPLGHSVFGEREGVFVARESDFFIIHTSLCAGKMSTEGEWLESSTTGCDERTRNYLKAYVQYFINGVIRNSLF